MSMIKTVFGELSFDTGWKTKTTITLFTKSYDVVVKAKAYFEKDGITEKQESAFSDFINQKVEKLKTMEELIKNYADKSSTSRFLPRTILFQRDGSYAVLLDDTEDPEGGIAIILSPTKAVLSQDEYL